ncbi:MAG: LLM class flavin-dependent oxidoreductase [Nitrososphaerota archaeon]|nr:LLM class flavin-dependent oxidoreductase [Nitrososphaerota archaeon]
MKLGVTFGHSLDPSEIVAGAVRCEKSGFDAIFVSESTGIDSLSVLGAIAAKTNQITLGSGVVNVYSRSATQLAMAAVTLGELSKWRFVLGIGASSKGVVSGWHGLEFSNQLQKVSESIDSMRKKIEQTGSKLHAEYTAKIPILLAAVGQKMISLARSKADGVIFFLRPLDLMKKDDLDAFDGSFQVCTSVVTCVSEQPEAAESRVRKTVAFYIAFGEAYRRLLVKQELLSDAVADSIRSEWMRGKIEQSATLVPRELLEQVAIFGKPADCKKKIEEYSSVHSLSHLLLQFNPGSNDLAESLSLLGMLSEKATMK